MSEGGIKNHRTGERGFTLQEVLTVIAIMGILIAIGVIIFLALLERWQVEAATNQIIADLRRAHASASNQLTDWRISLVFDREEEAEGPDYYLVKLAEPYDSGDPTPTVVERRPRFFPGNVQVMNVSSASGYVVDNPGEQQWVAPWAPAEPVVTGVRTMEFNVDGSMRWLLGPNGSTCVTVDASPENRVVALSSTSRVKVRSGGCPGTPPP